MLDDTWYSHGDLNGKTKHKSRTILFLWIKWFLCLDLQRLSIKHSFLCDSASTMLQPCWKINNGYKNWRFLFLHVLNRTLNVYIPKLQWINQFFWAYWKALPFCWRYLLPFAFHETHLHAAMSLTILRFVSWSSAYPQSLCFLSSLNTHKIACPEKC